MFVWRVSKMVCSWRGLASDTVHKQALLIDPVVETVERDTALCKELGLKLIYGLNTHCHADHVTGTGMLKVRNLARTQHQNARLCCGRLMDVQEVHTDAG